MRALGTIRATRRTPERDLWPRLHAALAEDEPYVQVRFPALTWPVGLSVAATASVLLTIPEPIRFLSAFGLL